MKLFCFVFSIADRPPYQVKKKRWVCQRLVCHKRESLLQDHLPVKYQDVNFKDPKFKHEIFVRIDMKHSYFSNYFIICLQSIFSAVESIIELFAVCQKLRNNFFSCYIKKFNKSNFVYVATCL